MLRQLLMGVALFVSPAYAGMCGDSDGTVKCTDDAGRNSTLESLDKDLISPSGVTAKPEFSLSNIDMATYPREPKSVEKPSRETEPQESPTTTFIISGGKTQHQ
jgi:hypothetical protein